MNSTSPAEGKKKETALRSDNEAGVRDHNHGVSCKFVEIGGMKLEKKKLIRRVCGQKWKQAEGRMSVSTIRWPIATGSEVGEREA